MVSLFKSICDRKPHMTEFNKEYAFLLKDYMRNSTHEQLPLFREEMMRFVGDKFASPLYRSSLSHYSFVALDACKRIVDSYLDKSIDIKNATLDQKQQHDPEVCDLRDVIITRRANKRKERINRSASFCMQTALAEGCTVLRGESRLSSAGSKKNSKKTNNTLKCWFAKGTGKKIHQLVKFHNLYFCTGPTPFTSHQDPGEHSYGDPKMKCRYRSMKVSEVCKYHLDNLGTFLKEPKKGKKLTVVKEGTKAYYKEGAKQFVAHYKLEDCKDKIASGKMSLEDFKKILNDATGNCDAKIFIPGKFGNAYLATHKLTTNAVKMTFNGKEVYASDSDEIAAINVGVSRYFAQSEKVSK